MGKERERLIKILEEKGIKDHRILNAIREIPREKCLPDDLKIYAYNDRALPIGLSQTISQPFIVAYMTEKLNIAQNETVLEIGTGSGYQAAILGKLAKEVYSVERIEELYERAKSFLKDLKIDNVHVKLGNGRDGWEEHAPYDKIMVTAAAKKKVPEALLDQLADRGKMIIPVGDFFQSLYIYVKEDNEIKKYKDLSVAFVPLL